MGPNRTTGMIRIKATNLGHPHHDGAFLVPVIPRIDHSTFMG